jgi:hypothetical protein
MNIIRKALTTLGGVSVAALLITAVAPKAARGVAAALVQVTNTSANPVPTVSADANFPYDAFLCTNESCGPAIPDSFSVPSTTTTGVPVKRLVFEDLNAVCPPGSDGVVGLSLSPSADNNAGPLLKSVVYQFLLTASGSGEFFGHTVVRMYADPLATVSIVSAGSCSAFVTGHLETK